MTSKQKLQLIVEILPEFEFESKYDLQSEINAHAAGFDECKDGIIKILEHRFIRSDSGNCSDCGQDIRHSIHKRL